MLHYKEMKFQSGEMFDESTAVELGKMSGAEMVFFGTIFRFGGRNIMSVKGMDIKTATLKYAKQANGETDIQLESAVKTIAAQITKDENGGTSYGGKYDDDSTVRIGKLSKSEQDFHDKYIVDKWGISANNKDDMLDYYQRHRHIGIALAAVGPSLIGVSIFAFAIPSAAMGFFGLVFVSLPVGLNFLLSGILITSLCAMPFTYARRIATIYRKTSGKKLTFIDRMDIGGGYDWENKEVTVAMAIKL